MGSNFTGDFYVRRTGRRIFVSSDGSHRPVTAFTPSEARAVAKRLVSEADAADGNLPRRELALTLHWDEAKALAAVLHRVGGDPDQSPRGKTQAVYNRLKDAGVTVPPYKFETVAGGLWFKTYDGQGADTATRTIAELCAGYMGRD